MSSRFLEYVPVCHSEKLQNVRYHQTTQNQRGTIEQTCSKPTPCSWYVALSDIPDKSKLVLARVQLLFIHMKLTFCSNSPQISGTT